MGVRGPPRKPRDLRLINGTLRPDRDDSFERPSGEALLAADRPLWLTPEAAAIWNALAEQGRLFKIDAGTLTVLVVAMDLHAKAVQALEHVDEKEYRVLERIVCQQARVVLQASAQLRLPVSIPPTPDNPFSRNGQRPRPPAA